MKNIALAIFLVASFPTIACDACGCSGMTVGFGDLSFYNQNSLGLRHSFRQFKTGTGISDYIQQIDLNGSYAINSDWSLSLSIPYIYAQRNQAESESNIYGISDITLKANYFLLRMGDEKKSHRIKLTGGLNLPTGKFENREASLIPQNFQVGTGGLDFQGELEYQFGYKNWVALSQARYLYNSTNPSNYKFGNQASIQLLFAYKIALKKIALVPLMGISYEHFDRDINARDFYQYGTGGESINAQLGVQLKLKDFLFSLRGGGNLRNHTNGDYNPGLQTYFSFNYLF